MTGGNLIRLFQCQIGRACNFFGGTFYEIRRMCAICLRIFWESSWVVVGLMIMTASDKAELDVGQCTEIAV